MNMIIEIAKVMVLVTSLLMRSMQKIVFCDLYMCFSMAPILSTTFIFFLYRPQKDVTILSDRICEKIDKVLTEFPSVSFHICEHFKYSTPRRFYSSRAKLMKKANTAETNLSPKKLTLTSTIRPWLLLHILFSEMLRWSFTSCSACQTSDKTDFKPKTSPDMLFHGTNFGT